MTKKKSKLINNPVDHPAHYTAHPSGIEAIEVCGFMGFNTGNAFKYVFRMEDKWDPIEDLKKSNWYIDRELSPLGPAHHGEAACGDSQAKRLPEPTDCD